MKIRAVVLPVTIALLLTGCAPEPLTPAPSPSVSEPSPEATTDPTTSPTSSPSPTEVSLALPADCPSLVPLATIKSEFSPSFVHIVTGPDYGGPDAQDFAARGGLTCTWGIPQSGSSAAVYAAERATATDAEQVAAWVAAGYSECLPFLDACYHEEVSADFGEYRTLFVLVGGFELRVQASTGSVDPLMTVARAAATSIGYI